MEGYPGKINLKAEGLYLEETFGSNPIAVCLANNHVLDYGNKGFIDTPHPSRQRRSPLLGGWDNAKETGTTTNSRH